VASRERISAFKPASLIGATSPYCAEEVVCFVDCIDDIGGQRVVEQLCAALDGVVHPVQDALADAYRGAGASSSLNPPDTGAAATGSSSSWNAMAYPAFFQVMPSEMSLIPLSGSVAVLPCISVADFEP